MVKFVKTLALTLGMGILGGGVAFAAPPPKAPGSAADAERPLLYLGVQWLGKPLKQARLVILPHLRGRQQVYKLPDPDLTPSEQVCHTADCLPALAKKQKVVRVLGGNAAEGENKLHVVNLWLLDLRLGGGLLEESGRCEACTDDKLNETFRRVTDALLDKAARAIAGTAPVAEAAKPAPPRPPVAPPPALAPPPPPPVVEAPRPVADKPPVLAMGVTPSEPARPASLSKPALVETPVDPRPNEPPHFQPPPPPEPVAPPAPSGESLAPVAPQTLAIAAAPRGPSYGRGVAVGVFSGLLAATLGTSIALTALDLSGSRPLCSIPSDPMGPAVDCAPRALFYGVGYGASAALLGGLILTLALPGSKESK